MAEQSLLNQLLNRGNMISGYADMAAKTSRPAINLPAPEAVVPAQPQNTNEATLENLMQHLALARQKQQARQAAEALQQQGGQVLSPRQ